MAAARIPPAEPVVVHDDDGASRQKVPAAENRCPARAHDAVAGQRHGPAVPQLLLDDGVEQPFRQLRAAAELEQDPSQRRGRGLGAGEQAARRVCAQQVRVLDAVFDAHLLALKVQRGRLHLQIAAFCSGEVVQLLPQGEELCSRPEGAEKAGVG
ncbi:hypothetical protein PoMZ_03289 [Pyricularia oryzae]|uniref:Uncharacterized protein n=1 Tax=Pyricularia oryzae TaxID=318829 RepID=A0A4P7N6V6_PYROR|nr:hypothetical protein PoMZ_03289 [Pyricularia oryzae]